MPYLKKLLLVFILFLLLIGVVGIYGALKIARRNKIPAPTKAAQTSITLLEGWNNKQIGDYLEKNGVIESTSFVAAQASYDPSAYTFLEDRPKGADLEGYIFPDTYFIPKFPASSTNISDFIITKALDNFDKKITPSMRQQAALNKLSLYQTITLASIIEKESNGNQDDKDIISGVFYNRLSAGMPLQSDATIAYVTGRPEVTNADTQIDSPYNTYTHTGLPAGPICNPSLKSIVAALYPQKTSYLYFLTDPATGRAVFAKTYDEHLQNKQKYLK